MSSAFTYENVCRYARGSAAWPLNLQSDIPQNTECNMTETVLQARQAASSRTSYTTT